MLHFSFIEKYARVSKIVKYEHPYIMNGNVKRTGLKMAPKDI
ncbi:Uncharacterised protein [Streptococcus pneumoniae]|uniref:Uncharacterized protein n=1 Tax=Bacillus paranthracis TaxID=2026186 RepID=A0A9X8X161_9BACI|nr:Uncharacterised protein [Streptococcus pneumoniae]CJQ17397.1 Uncharacterised protein [Streptococcus pneumoniae]SMD71068.1 hypothetical protein BACERE00221_00131 [Bacillus paranthracis]